MNAARSATECRACSTASPGPVRSTTLWQLPPGPRSVPSRTALRQARAARSGRRRSVPSTAAIQKSLEKNAHPQVERACSNLCDQQVAASTAAFWVFHTVVASQTKSVYNLISGEFVVSVFSQNDSFVRIQNCRFAFSQTTDRKNSLDFVVQFDDIMHDAYLKIVDIEM